MMMKVGIIDSPIRSNLDYISNRAEVHCTDESKSKGNTVEEQGSQPSPGRFDYRRVPSGSSLRLVVGIMSRWQAKSDEILHGGRAGLRRATHNCVRSRRSSPCIAPLIRFKFASRSLPQNGEQTTVCPCLARGFA
jgi:hypothetical protein